MPVLTRSSLGASPLADLHELASELELDGFRRLRKADLVDRILEVHGAGEGADSVGDEPAAEVEEKPKRARRPRRTRDADTGDDEPAAEAEEPKAAREPRETREPREPRETREQDTAEGVVELLGNGSGFVRVN